MFIFLSSFKKLRRYILNHFWDDQDSSWIELNLKISKSWKKVNKKKEQAWFWIKKVETDLQMKNGG